MKVVAQRVFSASVEVEDKIIGRINGLGWLLLVGVRKGDTVTDAEILAKKIISLRAFSDSDNKMNLDITEVKGEILAVSQFTLYGDCQKGRRPSFIEAASPEVGKSIYEHFVSELSKTGINVETGQFGAMMKISIQASGPVTLILDTDKK